MTKPDPTRRTSTESGTPLKPRRRPIHAAELIDTWRAARAGDRLPDWQRDATDRLLSEAAKVAR